MKSYFAIGLMSGTSLDGLDICYVKFPYPEVHDFEIIQAETLPYNEVWKNRLKNSIHLSAEAITQLDFDYGTYLGKAVQEFIEKHQIQKVDFIASHGHTVFHNPAQNYTLQIGKGQGIFAETGIPTVFDFRSQDVLLGGQGAPLVPIGDKLLFKDFDSCLNLGGFSNISFEKNSERIAFDICPVNIVLNQFAESIGKNYDTNGKIARSGTVNSELLIQLNKLDYYQKQPPKSLGLEYCLEFIFPILTNSKLKTDDILSTFTEHIANQIAVILNQNSFQNVLVTGGGSYNVYLIERINSKTDSEIVLPENLLIDYKEALIFALMGLLRLEKKINVLASVTGASKNHSSGVIVS